MLPHSTTMRPPLFLLALVTVRGVIGVQARRARNANKIDAYFDQLIPVVNDTILHKNSGPGIQADVKKRPLSVRDTC